MISIRRNLTRTFSTTSQLPTKGPFRWTVRLGKLTLLLCGLTGGVYYTTTTYETHTSRYYFGETQWNQRLIEKDIGIDAHELLPKVIESIFFPGFYHRWGRAKPWTAGESLIEKYPNNPIGYILLAYCEKALENHDYANALLSKASNLIEKFPEKNEKFKYLMPPKESSATGLIERVHNRIWTLSVPFMNPSRKYAQPLDLQTTLFRDKNGKVIIINPVQFKLEHVETINKLGEVVAIVNPSSAHSDCLIPAASLWPNAKVYTSLDQKEKESKEKDKKIQLHPLWKQSVFPVGELSIHSIEGRYSREFVLYDKESKTLLGLTDIIISPTATKEWGFALYHLGLGLYKGPSFTTNFSTQSYQYLQIKSPRELKNSIQEILSLDIERLPLGHGGYFEGKEVKGELRQALHYFTEFADQSWLERWGLSLGFLSAYKIIGKVWEAGYGSKTEHKPDLKKQKM